MFLKRATTSSTETYWEQIHKLHRALEESDAILLGAGAGLSTSAGFSYGGERFHQYFSDFEEAYGFHDMYTGGFYPFPTLEEHWAYWSRFVFLNRYCDPPKPVYQNLLELVKGKDYFVLTTNVDHCFQKAGFDKERLFYTQGDYGLWQCSRPCCPQTYDNQETVWQMVEAQGFQITEQGLTLPAGAVPKRSVPTELVPHCPVCGAPMTMNLRADNTFVEDGGWHRASQRYGDFVRRHQDAAILYLELGVGMNTPGIIKFNFWQQVYHNPKASYGCINLSDGACPREIEKRSVCIQADISAAIDHLPGE